MIEQVENLFQEALARLKTAENSEALNDWFRDTLGGKGNIQLLTRQIGQLPVEDRPRFWQTHQ